MKKIKLFALAVFAMLSTNAFAAVGEKKADGSYRYEILTGETTAKIIGFVANHEEAVVVIPTQVQDPDDANKKYDVVEVAAEAFKGQTGITSVTIPDTKVTTIGYGAFAGCTKLTTVTIGKAVVNINSQAAAAIAAVLYTDETAAAYNASLGGAITTTTELTAEQVATINAIEGVSKVYAVGNNPIEADAKLYNAKLEGAVKAGDEKDPAVPAVLEGAFEGCTTLATVTFNAATDPQTIAAGTFKNTAITSLDLTGTKITALNPLFETVGAQVAEIKLPATLESIEESAFEGLTKLTTIDFTACTQGITIKANAFKNAMKITSFEVPEQVVRIKDGAFTGSYITTLTVKATVADKAITLGDGGAALGATKITTLTINGANVTIAGKAFEDAAALATVTFDTDLASNTVLAGAFKKVGEKQKIKVYYTPVAGKTAAINAFAQTAFKDAAGLKTDIYVTFFTSEDYGKRITIWTEAAPYGVGISYDAVLPEIPVYKNGGTYAYGGFIAPAGGITIAKKQGENKDINVMVYGAYFDNIDTKANKSAILMDQMHLINGNYYLPEGTKFIVKSSSEEKVQYSVGNDGKDSQNYNVGTGLQNEIKAYTEEADCYANSLFSAGKVIYFLRDLAGGKEFGWKQRSDDAVIKKGQLYLEFTGTASARIELIWSDGSEETTAIQTVKTATEDGAIYNLAGQKVSASYKGVVIKNGKKMIQK